MEKSLIEEWKPKKKKGSNRRISNAALQTKIRSRLPRLIAEVYRIATHSRNERTRLEAVRILVNKVLPDVRSMEVTKDERKQVLISLGMVGVGEVIEANEPLEQAAKLSTSGNSLDKESDKESDQTTRIDPNTGEKIIDIERLVVEKEISKLKGGTS